MKHNIHDYYEQASELIKLSSNSIFCIGFELGLVDDTKLFMEMSKKDLEELIFVGAIKYNMFDLLKEKILHYWMNENSYEEMGY